MKQSSIAEFAQYRFVRDRENNVITLPAQGIDERNLLVLDCERWGLARLHIFEEAAKRQDKLEAFQEEMQKIARMRSPSVVRITSWGRDEEELFYASEMQDGEPLPAYLDRTGGVPFSIAAEWMSQLFSLLESVENLTASFERFTTLNYQVIVDHFGVVRPVFSEFYGWTRPGAHVREHPLDWYLAQIFCSLIVGVPVRTFHENSLPRNFEELDQPVQDAILDSLEERSEHTYEQFKSVMTDLSAKADAERSGVALPKMPVREWFREDLEKSYDTDADYELPEEPDSEDEVYAVETRLRGKSANVQILPGPASIPRTEWLNQHHDATRRPGRGTINQLQVSYVEDRDSLTLIGEERVDGVDLASLIREIGPRSEEEAKIIAGRVCNAIDLLEQNVGNCSVWWLPPENVFVLTGTRSREASGNLVGRKGSDGWADYPIKLRLHQTTATLKEGVNLPPSVRRLSREPGRGFRNARRSAILVPLVWRLLVGTRFRWAKPVKKIEGVSPGLIDLFEEYRVELRENPEDLEKEFLEAMNSLVLETKEKPKKDDLAEKVKKGDAALEEAFGATLFDGELDTNVDLEKESEFTSAPEDKDAPAPALERPEEEPAKDPEPEERTAPKSRLPWLWAAVAGAVVAAIFGFLASDWSKEQSVYEVAPEIEFPEPEFEPRASADSEQVITVLQDFLLEEGGPQNLKLLHLIQVFDFEANRIAIENALRAAAKERKPTAAMLLAGLARTRGKAPEEYRPWMLQAAKMGDAEAQFRYANEILSAGVGGEERDEAVSLLALAAAEGHDPSRELWAVTVMDTQPAEAYKMVQSAAADGISSAIFTQGLFQANGIGTDIDESAAAASFKKAAELGDVEAMYWFARCLEVGYGVETSFTEAQRWMKNAASQGNAKAEQWCEERDIQVVAPIQQG